jgi:protein gp37
MSDKSTIEWTDATWNPVTGCTKVSTGCANCYAEKFSERFRGVPGHHFEQGFDLKIWPSRLNLPFLWKEPRRVFVNSMSDLFHEKVKDEYIAQVFEVMERAEQHIFQVLTKRTGRMATWIKTHFPNRNIPTNIWMGTSLEKQEYYQRVDYLKQVPASVRFLSVEPLLGPIKFKAHDLRFLKWVIVGGESGPKARPMDGMWAIDIRNQCEKYGVPFFFKQWGAYNSKGIRVGKKRAGRRLEGKIWDKMPEDVVNF